MKKILVTGAAGNIGFQVIKSLLTESKYQVTALDLKFKNSIKNFKKYGKRIEFVFGDINNEDLINELVQDKDIVIHLAAVSPPLANIKPELTELVNYQGSKIIIKAIKETNPKCFFLFASSSSVYGERTKDCWISIKDPIVEIDDNHYVKSKIDIERLIKKELKHYSIFRLAPTLIDVKKDPNIFNMPLNAKLEMITKKDAAYAFTRAVDYIDELKGKTFNLGGGDSCRISYREFLIKLLEIYGLNYRYIKSLIIGENNYYCGFFKDSDDLEDLLKYRCDSLNDYYNQVKKENKFGKRIINKIFAYPFIIILKRKG